MRVFLDTNILVYAFSADPKKAVAFDLLRQGGVISVQSLAEFANVARRKLRHSVPEVAENIRLLIDVLSLEGEVSLPILDAALHLADRYKLSIHDSTLIAVALDAGCDQFLSEDMHHGLVIEDRLTVRNPFLIA